MKLKPTGRLVQSYCPNCKKTKEWDEYEDRTHYHYKCRTCGFMSKGEIPKDTLEC